MDSIFRVAWERLELDDVEAFLADAEGEGLTWEAKGTERPRPGSVRKQVCGFANAIGGFLMVGVSGEAGAWVIDGVDFGQDEPSVWLGSTIRNGLHPVPRYDVREWPLHDSRKLAIVRVQPIAVPPCMAGGEVFERVSGETVRVVDGAVLRRLTERGQARESAAEATALDAATASTDHPDGDRPYLRLRIALVPTGLTDDVDGTLFTPEYEEAFEATYAGLPIAPVLHDLVYLRRQRLLHRLRFSQDALVIEGMYEERQEQTWNLIARRDGCIVAECAASPSDRDDGHVRATELLERAIAPALSAAAELAERLGGYGRTYGVVSIASRGFRLWTSGQAMSEPIPGPADLAPFLLVMDDGRATEDQLRRMRRELERACGFSVYEPADE